jgi:hypothetical protein
VTFAKRVRVPPVLEDDALLALDPEAAAIAAAASAKFAASVQADADELASVAAFAERRVRRADRWRLRERGNSQFLTPLPSSKSLTLLPPLSFIELEGGLESIVVMEAVHSDNGGESSASITLQRRLADNGVGDATEDVEEKPIYGRTYWVTLLTTHSDDVNNIADVNDVPSNKVVVRHKLIISIGVPHNEPSVYSHTFARTDNDESVSSTTSSSSPTISNDIIEGAQRLMNMNSSNNTQQKQPITENVKTNNVSSNINMNEMKSIIRDVVRDTVRDVVREELKDAGMLVESTTDSNEVIQFKVGKHLFVGRVTKVKKLA